MYEAPTDTSKDVTPKIRSQKSNFIVETLLWFLSIFLIINDSYSFKIFSQINWEIVLFGELTVLESDFTAPQAPVLQAAIKPSCPKLLKVINCVVINTYQVLKAFHVVWWVLLTASTTWGTEVENTRPVNTYIYLWIRRRDQKKRQKWSISFFFFGSVEYI